MSNAQQMRPDHGRNECESDADKWMESVKEAAKSDDSASKKEEASGFLQQTGVQVSKLAQEAAGAMKNAMMKSKSANATPSRDDLIAFQPKNDPSFREYTP